MALLSEIHRLGESIRTMDIAQRALDNVKDLQYDGQEHIQTKVNVGIKALDRLQEDLKEMYCYAVAEGSAEGFTDEEMGLWPPARYEVWQTQRDGAHNDAGLLYDGPRAGGAMEIFRYAVHRNRGVVVLQDGIEVMRQPYMEVTHPNTLPEEESQAFWSGIDEIKIRVDNLYKVQ